MTNEGRRVPEADYDIISLKARPELANEAAEWFSRRWGVPAGEYLERMEAYISGITGYGWYLCMDGEKIAGGLGIIDNDFHDRKDLAPNICAVYTLPEYRGQGIAGRLLNRAVDELRSEGISSVYLLTDHTAFYERYGWEYFCDALNDDGGTSRIYIHR